MASLLMLLALSSVRYAAAGPTKWTILVYMLADNNLEQFGLFDLEVRLNSILHLVYMVLIGNSAAHQALVLLSYRSWCKHPHKQAVTLTCLMQLLAAVAASPRLHAAYTQLQRPCNQSASCFDWLLLQEMMAAMADERTGDCTTTACGGACPAGKVETYTDSTNCQGGSFTRRCCSPGNYPDVLIMVDKGQGNPLPYRVYQNFQKMQYADYSLLEGYWTNAKTVKALPGVSTAPAPI